MADNPFALLNSLNDKTYIDVDLLPKNEFNPFMVNRGMSLHYDVILYANEANMMSHIDPKLIYDFYYHAIRQKKRFAKWPKKETEDTVKFIMKNYNYSEQKAKAVMRCLTPTQIDEIVTRLSNKG